MKKNLIFSMLAIGMLSGGYYNESFAMQAENAKTINKATDTKLTKDLVKAYLAEIQKSIDALYTDNLTDDEFDKKINELATFRIPNTYKSIEKGAFKDAFKDAPDIKSVIIPNSVTMIKQNAFSECQPSKEITIKIPDSVAIDELAFTDCGIKVQFIVPSQEMKNYLEEHHYIKAKISVDTSLVTKENKWKWPKYGKIKIPNGTTTLDSNMFTNRKDLTEFTIPDSISSFDYLPFRTNSKGGTITFIVPSQQMSNHIHSVLKNSNITYAVEVQKKPATEENKWKWPVDGKIEIPSNVNNIHNRMFHNRNDIESVEMHDNIRDIGNGAFDGCESLKQIKLPARLESIGHSAFANCKSLDSIKLPNSVKTIESRAFSMCQKLHTIDIPESVISIGKVAFGSSAKNLPSIIVHSERVKDLVIGSETKGIKEKIIVQ